MTPRARGRLAAALKLAVTLSLLALSLRMIRLDALRDSLLGADARLLAIAALILTVGGFAGAASWFFVLRVRLPALGFRDVAACHWSGMFFNSFLPSNVGGDVVKGYIVARAQGQTGFVVASLLLDRVINLAVLLGIGIFALLLQLGQRAAAGVFLLLAAGLLPVAPLLARRLLAALSQAPRVGRKGRLAELVEPILELAATPRLLWPALAAALASQLCKTGQNVFVIYALNLRLPARCVWHLIPLFGVVSALPVSIGGLGLREMVAQSLAGPLALDDTHLVALSLAGHLMVALVNMLGAIPFLRCRPQRATPPAPPPTPMQV